MALAFSSLTTGSHSTSNPSTTASIAPTSGGVVYAFVVGAWTGTPTTPSMSVSGCSLTWTEIGAIAYGGRRRLHAFIGTGTATSGTLSVEASNVGGTWTENAWVIVEATGQDATPTGTVYSGSGSGATTLAVTVSQTPDAGDMVLYAVGLEDSQSVSIDSELDTALASSTGGTDFRALHVLYDSSPDSTPVPDVSWSSACDTGGLAFIVNAAAGGGGQEITPTKGTITLTGRQPTITQTTNKTLSPVKGTLTLTGKIATVAQTGNQSIAAVVGHLTTTGYAPSVTRTAHQSIGPPTLGHLTLTGKVATVANQAALIEWDDSGADEGYRVKWGLASDTYSWSADVATDVLEYKILGLIFGTKYYVRIYALVGGVEQDPSDEIMLTAGFGFEPQTGHLTLTGYAPSIAQGTNQTLSPSVGHLSLTGRVATLAQSDHRSLTPTLGHLTLTGYIPGISVGQLQFVEPTTGSLTLTGYAPTVAQTTHKVLEPVAGNLSLTGYAPTVGLTGNVTVAPAGGNLSLTGYVPTVAQTGLELPRRRRDAGAPGRGQKKPRRMVWVEPEDDGPEIEVETPADVPRAVKAVKRQAKAIAERAIKAHEPIPELPQWIVHGDAQHAEDLRQRIEGIRANFAYIYQMMLLEQRRREEDEEDVFLLTL